MSFKDKVAYMTSRIGIYLPSLDTSPSSIVRVIIDAVAEMSAQADLAEEKVFEWDITKIEGQDLDDFVFTFGFSRVPATHATGFVTARFAGNTSRDYIIEKGSRVWGSRPDGTTIDYEVATNIAVPRYSSVATIPIVAAEPGPEFNARPGEIRNLEFSIDSLIYVINELPVSGGKETENDEELRKRFRADLFRNVVSTEDYYRSIARRHPRVVATQLIKPRQEVEEHLKIAGGEAMAQEDSLTYTYPRGISVFNVEKKVWLREGVDFEVTIDNDTPQPPLFQFLSGGNWDEGESIRVRYGYCSTKSRNDPLAGVLHRLDLFVTNNQPAPIIDFSFWPIENEFGSNLTRDTHPDGIEGDRYYIFVRQPVLSLHPEIHINGRTYKEGRDYYLVKDTSENADSTRARDIICFSSPLPEAREGEGRPGEPGFHIPYYHDSVISDIQAALDDPEIRGAADDIVCHAAERLNMEVKLTIEWEGGMSEDEALQKTITDHFSTVEMGTKLKVGPLMRAISNSVGVTAAYLDSIKLPRRIRGRNSYQHDVPLPDGSIPILEKLIIQTTAPNIYEDRIFT